MRSRDTVMRGVGTTYEDMDLDVCVYYPAVRRRPFVICRNDVCKKFIDMLYI